MDKLKEYIEQQLVNIRQQKENHRNAYHQAVGAEQMLVNILEEYKNESDDK